MIDRRELAQDLRAHAHEVPEHIGRIMRAAAADNLVGRSRFMLRREQSK